MTDSTPCMPSRACGPGVSAQPDRVEAVARLDRVERAVEDLPPLEDHEDPVAQPLGHRHVVRREDDRRAVPLQFQDGRSLSTSVFTGSSPENGSSRITSSGPVSTVAMNWIFWAMPFDRASIFLSIQSDNPIRSSQSAMASSSSGCRHALQLPRSTAAVVGRSSFCRAHALQASTRPGRPRHGCRARPSTSTTPASGSKMCRIIRNVVVLPDPFGPMNPYSDPRGTSRSRVVHRDVRPERLVTPTQDDRITARTHRLSSRVNSSRFMPELKGRNTAGCLDPNRMARKISPPR